MHFTCGDSNLHQSVVYCQNILSLIADTKSISGLKMVFWFKTRKSLNDILRRLQDFLATPPGRSLDDVLKKSLTSSNSDKSTTSWRPKLKRL